MTERPLVVHGETVQIDVCDGCGGVFLEYFDGEPGALARAMQPHAGLEPVFATPPQCPDCEVSMELRDWLEDGGPELMRCDGCMAIFATPSMLEGLARYTRSNAAEQPGGGLLDALRALLGV